MSMTMKREAAFWEDFVEAQLFQCFIDERFEVCVRFRCVRLSPRKLFFPYEKKKWCLPKMKDDYNFFLLNVVDWTRLRFLCFDEKIDEAAKKATPFLKDSTFRVSGV